MNVFDVGIILLLIMSFIIGFKNGVVKELVALLGIILVFIISYLLKGYLGDIFCIFFPFFRFIGKIEGITMMNIVLYQIIAFLVIFTALLGLYATLLKISKKLQKLVNLTIILWLPSKVLGGIVSVIKGYIVLLVVFTVLMIPLGNQEIFYNSTVINTMLYHTPVLSRTTQPFTNAVREIYDLGESISKDNISKEAANAKALDIILKYNITKKATIEKLIEIHKIENNNGIEGVLNNY